MKNIRPARGRPKKSQGETG